MGGSQAGLALRCARRLRESGSLALRAGLEVLGDDLVSSVLATSTAAADRKLALHFEQGPRALVDALADLAVTHCVADANVHLVPSPSHRKRLLMGV